MKFDSEVELSLKINGKTYDKKLFDSLKLISTMNSQRKVAKELGISHSVLNRRIINAEKNLDKKLVLNFKNGSKLSSDGFELLNEYYEYYNKLKETDEIIICGGHIVSSFLESISSEIPFKTRIYSSDDESAFKLAKRGLVDILALDDPLIAFEYNLNFKPIGHDFLTLVSSFENYKINNINDLKDFKFISVKGTAQRLAWNTLNQYHIPFSIVKEVKSQFDAYKIIRNSKDLHTFLNASYFKGNNLLKNATNHVISLIKVHDDKKEVNKLLDYLLNEGQLKIKNNNFTPIKTFK
ncbi:MAG: LysR family transcriptional regulator [Methanobacteriaceae archaeon]|jgi:molybdenum-dependent DNA-binding transcriptional regulator ModE|nr:LysR family transcriptional regulator [Methanobacteriaceae archaeon]